MPFSGGRGWWIRFPAGKPRRLQHATGMLPSAAFRIHQNKKNTAKRHKPFGCVWWGMVDSNHRRRCQQIYSLSPLATREIPQIQLELVDGFAFLRESHGGCNMPPACCQVPPFESVRKRMRNMWSWWTDSNPRPADYKSAALPAELHQHLTSEQMYISRLNVFCQPKFQLLTAFFTKEGVV